VWNAETGECIKVLEGHTGYVASVAWSPCGSKIASGSMDNTARVWNAETGGSVKLEGHTSGVTLVAWSPDSLKLASGSRDRTVRVWRMLSL